MADQQLTQPSVQNAPLPGIRMSADAPLAAFGGGQASAEATQAAGDLANSAAEMEYKRAKALRDLSDLKTNYGVATQLSQLQTNLLYDAKTGAVNQHGTNADGITTKVMDAWQKGVSDIGGQLQSPEQVEAFQRQVASHQVELYRAVGSHESKEKVGTTVNTITATAATYADAAEKSALSDSAASQLNLRRADAAYQELATLHGLTPESRKAFLNTQNSQNHMRILTALVDAGQDLKAEQYFKDNKDSFFGNDYTKALEKTQQASVLGESYRQLDIILEPRMGVMPAGTEGPTQPVPRTRQEAQSEAQKIQNPKVRHMTTELVKAHFVEQEQAARQDVSDAFMDASRQMNQEGNRKALQNGTPIEAILTPSLIDRVAASPEHLNALRAMSQDRQVSEPDAVIQMSRLISDKAALGKMDISEVLSKVGGRLNTSDRAGLRKAWDEAHEAILKNAATPVPTAEVDRAVNDALVNFKLPGSHLWGSQPFEKGATKLNGEAKDRYIAFRDEVYRLAQAEKAVKGRPLGPDEIQNVVDKALSRQVDIYKPSFFGGPFPSMYTPERLPYGMKLPGEKFYPESKMTGQLEVIPEKDRAALVGIINQTKGSDIDWRSVSTDDARLQRMWLAFKSGNKDLLTRIASE